jgi:ABC-type uncharacterized transport system permease subunit
MQYQVQDDEAQRAKNPHHIYNLNIILVHLFLSLSILKTTGNMLMFILVPLISIAVLSFIRYKAYQKMRDDTWFVSAHWMLAWRRGRLLIISYAAAIFVVSLYLLLDWITPSGMTMNNFAEDGSSTPIFQIITMFFGGAIVFFTVLITFLQTGISVYDAGKGIVDKKMANFVPRDYDSNIELGEYNDRDPGQKNPDDSGQK